jgi:hypothetical protein
VAVKENDHVAFWKLNFAERVVVVFSNSHNANFASWQIFTCQNVLWLLQNVHNATFRVVAVLLLPQRVLVVFFLAHLAF